MLQKKKKKKMLISTLVLTKIMKKKKGKKGRAIWVKDWLKRREEEGAYNNIRDRYCFYQGKLDWYLFDFLATGRSKLCVKKY